MCYKVLKILTSLSFLILPLPAEKISPPMIIFLPLSLVTENFLYGFALIYGVLFLLFSGIVKLPLISDSWIAISIVLFMYKCLFSWIEPEYTTTHHIVLFVVFGILSLSFLIIVVKQAWAFNQTPQQS